MADSKAAETKADKPAESKEETKAPEGNLSPNEDKSLPQGVYGGAATINNPARASVVYKEKLDK